MRRGRIFIYLAFILILGLVAAVFVWQRYLNKPVAPSINEPAPTQVVDTVNVIVVTQRVPRGSVIQANVLGLVPIQRQLFIQGMFSNISDVEGKRAKLDLDAGMFLTGSMVADTAEQLSATGSLAALAIPRGMVAVSIPIGRLSSVSYAPQAGDHVNVIATLMFVDLDTDFQTILPNMVGTIIAPGTQGEGTPDYLTAQLGAGGGTLNGRVETLTGLGQSIFLYPAERQRGRLVSQSLLQDAVVLGVGTFKAEEEQPVATPVEAQPPAEGQPTPTPVAPSLPDMITLIVNPQDAVTLNYLLFSGAQLTLALRSAEDNTRVEIQAVTLQFLLSQYNIPVPVKLPYGMEPRTDKLVLPEPVPTPTPEAP
jgi:pilus assembly protein CpaB